MSTLRSHVHLAVMLIDAGMSPESAMRVAADVKTVGITRVREVLLDFSQRSRNAEKTSREHAEQLEAVLAALSPAEAAP